MGRKRSTEPKPKKGFLDGYKTYDTSQGFGNRAEWAAAWKAMNHEEVVAVLQDTDPLSILGFSQLPSLKDLDERFRKLVQQHHPDHGGDPKEFKKVYAAWSALQGKCK